MNRETLSAAVEQYGTPLYVYSLPEIRTRAQAIRRAFDDRFAISYAVKANPNPALLRQLHDVVRHLDVSSLGELKSAKATGWPPENITFTGPGKTRHELNEAVRLGIGAVIVESLAEAALVSELSAPMGRRQRILLRIAPQKLPPGFGVHMAGRPTQFGIDEEVVDDAVAQVLTFKHVELAGFHIYAGTQCLKPDSICENYKNCVEIFRRLADLHDLHPRMLVFGSSLGIPYHEGDVPLNLEEIGHRTTPLLNELKSHPRFAAAGLLLEMGRYLVGEAGYYLTRVIRRKSSRGAEIAIMDGGLHHNLAACGHLGSVIHRNYRFFPIKPLGAHDAESPFELVGPLCTSIDTLGHGVKLPSLQEGDVLAMQCAGAYGLTASPMCFISHPLPREVLFEGSDAAPVFIDASTRFGI